mgnify:CR=1 FL=1|tara:strand:+ start:303 stop:746 length:444 start_codon:yes stop_codon:yes gene_type:complete
MHIATKGSKIDISSERKLEDLAKKYAFEVKKGDIFFLLGEMGVGKTTFVKYLINNLQIKFHQKVTEVNSPTFNIMNEYSIGSLLIKHFDLYRLKSPHELSDLNIFGNKDEEIIFIEWPQLIEKRSNLIVKLYFEYENDFKNRYVKIK